MHRDGLQANDNQVEDALERAHQRRLLNRLLKLFVPVLILITSITVYFDVDNGMMEVLSNIVATLAGFGALFFVYLLNKRGYYKAAVWSLVLLPAVIIYFAVYNSPPPHLEIIYLALLFMVAKPLLDRRGLLLTCAYLMVILIAIGLTTPSASGYTLLFIGVFLVSLYYVLAIISDFRVGLETERNAIVKASELRQQMLLDEVPALVWTANERHEPLSVHGNQEQLRPVFADYLADMLQQHEGQPAAAQFELDCVWEGRNYHNVVTVQRAPSGEVQSYMGLTLDVTARHENEQRQRQQIKELEQKRAIATFLSSAAHDLRTPLSVLSTTAYLLSKAGPEKHARYVERLQNTTAQLTKTLEDMFYVVRLDDTGLRDQSIALRTLLESVVSQIEETVQNSARRIEADLQLDKRVTLAGNPDALERALCNILENAVQHTADDGLIEVRASTNEGATVVITIRDDGSGIAPEHLPHLFEPFYRVESHRPLDENNSGLGLTIAQRVVRTLDGQIAVSSNVGVGSTFTITLPLPTPN